MVAGRSACAAEEEGTSDGDRDGTWLGSGGVKDLSDAAANEGGGLGGREHIGMTMSRYAMRSAVVFRLLLGVFRMQLSQHGTLSSEATVR